MKRNYANYLNTKSERGERARENNLEILKNINIIKFEVFLIYK
jgi:hypothetical protein